jgi:cobyrinic acid a,c-diamide synthase
MSRLPRLALGTVQPGADATALVWGLLAALERNELRVQNFLSRACFTARDGATAITGQPPRHLDSWLMSSELCRRLFLRGVRSADIAIVEGAFAASSPIATGGDLATLCDWLALPRLAIVDVSRLEGCCLPTRPVALDGVVLDCVVNQRAFFHWQTVFESLWGVPVFGAMPAEPELRQAIGRLPIGAAPSHELCQFLANSFERFSDVGRLVELSTRYDFPFRGLDGPWERSERISLRIAMACDEAFRCYFPDTLDLLELKGATICDFSPLKDERLPPGTDIVYFGCGRPDTFAAELMANTCMTSALREHLCNGQRIYAECGGLAYLSREIAMPDGSRLPMVGALPVVARWNVPTLPQPVETRLSADCWLGQQGDVLRGYLNSRWTLHRERPAAWPIDCAKPPESLLGTDCRNQLVADAALAAASAFEGAEGDFSAYLVARHQAIGSRLHLNFAAQPAMLESFFHPHAAMMDRDNCSLARAL